MTKNILALLISITFFVASCKNEPQTIEKTVTGYTLGTPFHIKYLSKGGKDYRLQLDSIYKGIVHSMSTYEKGSDIDRVNKGDTTVVVDQLFKDVYYSSKKIWEESDGMFDPTIGIMVNAWGFGPKTTINSLDKSEIKKLMITVGFEKTRILTNGIFQKDYKDTQIDFNAIAKGYTLDRVAVFLDSKGVKNYMIEIGGEIVVKGKKLDGSLWRIGIDDPDQENGGERVLTAIIDITDKAMATSGNYRKFRLDSLTGEKFVHTINAKTGMATRSNMLSASVMAKNCTLADGYATTFMAMGLEKTKEFLKKHPELDAYLIYSDDEGKWQTYMTKQFKVALEKNN